MTSTLMNTYSRLPVTFARGEGVWLWDTEGKRYLDALSGIAVNTLGHGHARLVSAIAEQVGRLMHVSNLYGIAESQRLADRLAAISGMDNAFFCNSGCEANEAAIKLARLYGHQRNVANPSIIVMENAFHGRTLATLSATGSRKVQAGFEPLVSGFVRVPFNDINSIQHIAEHNPGVVAILVEPIQGEGGINVSSMEYLRALREICDRQDWLLMLDEVQCGIGRTGKWFAYQLAGIMPDVVTLAKGLGGGVPIGACLARGTAATVFHPGNHGSTFGGNPLATAAAFATLEILQHDGLLDNAVAMGSLIQDGLRDGLQGVPGFVETRGRGLMLGVQLDRPCAQLVIDALAAGLLINVTADNVVRLLPALVINPSEAGQLVERLVRLIKAFLERTSVAAATARAH